VVLAGGQSLVPLLNLRRCRPERLVDIGAVAELQRVVRDAGGHLIIGAGTPMAAFEREPALSAAAPLLAEALTLVGNPQVRARGTIGGCVAHRDAVGEVLTALVALEAMATVRGPRGERREPVETLALGDGELLVDLRVPPPDGSGTAFDEIALRYSARALVVAAAVVTVSETGGLERVRVVVGGVGSAPAALERLECLRSLPAGDARIESKIARSVGELPAVEDPRADERYRREAAAILAVRVVRDAALRGLAPPQPGCGPVTIARRPQAPLGERDGASEITLRVNGESERLEVEPRLLLSDLLRGRLGLRATHVGCEQGVCGACNVLVDGVAVRSCLMFAVQADGRHVQTLEGLRDRPDVAALADAFVGGHALQCGFCTAGFLVTLAELRASGAPVTAAQLMGNLCRCTGYVPIVRAAQGSEW
jgi:xanthine dehydrogenase iron-sulfur cluster and FAD-binding subunit A